MGDILSILFLHPFLNVIVLIMYGLQAVHIPGTLGLTIILLTVLIRFVLYPLTTSQLKASQKMQNLAPQISELRKIHKGDNQRVQLETMKLYKEHGINPAAGCLPMLLQLPFFIGLYQSISVLFNSKDGLNQINNALYSFVPRLKEIPDPHILGLNLAHKPSEFSQYGWVLLLVPVITAVLQLIQSKMMSVKPVKPYPSDSQKEKAEKSETEDAMQAVQSQMTFMMPLMIGFFSWQFPLGLALYWNTFTVFGILQQYHVQGLGGLKEWKDKINQWTQNKKK